MTWCDPIPQKGITIQLDTQSGHANLNEGLVCDRVPKYKYFWKRLAAIVNYCYDNNFLDFSFSEKFQITDSLWFLTFHMLFPICIFMKLVNTIWNEAMGRKKNTIRFLEISLKSSWATTSVGNLARHQNLNFIQLDGI